MELYNASDGGSFTASDMIQDEKGLQHKDLASGTDSDWVSRISAIVS